MIVFLLVVNYVINFIDMIGIINKDKLSNYKDEIDFDKKVFDELLSYAISNLKIAKSKHDVIEAYYVPNMRFNEIEELKIELIKKISIYKNRRGRYNHIFLWCDPDMGVCKINPIFVTNYMYEPIEIEDLIINVKPSTQNWRSAF